MNIRLGEYSPIFTEPEGNNYFSIITQVIIREKQEPSEKMLILFVCLFVCLDVQSDDHMLNRNQMLNQ